MWGGGGEHYSSQQDRKQTHQHSRKVKTGKRKKGGLRGGRVRCLFGTWSHAEAAEGARSAVRFSRGCEYRELGHSMKLTHTCA